MFRDRNKELGRIQQALLEEEEYFHEADEAEVLAEISRAFDDEQEPPAPEPVMPPRKKRRKENLKPLILSALLMTIAILGLLIFWALRIQL